MDGKSIKVLVVDDSPEIVEHLTDVFEMANMDVSTALDGEAGLQSALRNEADVIVLDIVMPGMTGFELIARLRAAGSNVPVIMLTGLADQEDVIRGLGSGADDYVTKPFSTQELLARVEAVLRRARMATSQMIRVGDLEVDVVRSRASRGGERVSLTPTEFDLLRVLASAPGKVFSREDLLRAVWEMDFDPGTNLVDVHLSRLRSKLRREGREPLIHTVRGQGFQLTGAAAEA